MVAMGLVKAIVDRRRIRQNRETADSQILASKMGRREWGLLKATRAYLETWVTRLRRSSRQ